MLRRGARSLSARGIEARAGVKIASRMCDGARVGKCEHIAYSLALLAMIFGPTKPVHAHQINQQAKPQTMSVGNVTFTLKRMQDGWIKEDRIMFHTTVLSASDGGTIYESVIPFHDASDADQEVDRMVHLSNEIIRQGKEIDKKGRTIGRRLLIRLPPGKSRKSFVWLVWNDRNTVHEVGSDSLNDLLALERILSGKTDLPK